MTERAAEDVRRLIDSARAHEAAQRAEAHRLEAELPELNARLGAARTRQEHMQRPSTLVTEVARLRVESWLARLPIRRTR